MHTKRFRRLSIELCEEAVRTCFSGKWRRRDVLSFVEKYAGIQKDEILIEELTGERKAREEAIHSCALALCETIEEILSGEDPEDVEPVKVRKRPDGMTGKVRDIALLCIMHQLIGHAVKLMLDPLFKAKILPTQHASLPGHGQTRLKNQANGYLLRESLGITYVQKTDVVSAYKSLMYERCIDIVKKEAPKAKDLHCLMAYLGRKAPGGHLVIGGYLDAWLFNLAMSYAIRYLYTLGTTRREKFIPYIIRCGTFMDDFGLFSASIKGLQRSTKALDKWMEKNLGIHIKITTGIIKILPIKEEQRRRSEPQGKAKRGCPALDMAGYKICRSHITIRRRVFLKARRQFLRGYREFKQNGTLSRDRATKIIAYNGYVEQTDSEMLKRKYHTEELMEVAEAVSGFYNFLDYKKRMEELYVLQQRRIGDSSGESKAGTPPRKNNRKADGQCDKLPDR